MIERPPATLLSRSIELRMKRKRPDEKTMNFRGDRVDSALKDMQRKFAGAAIDHADVLRRADPDMGSLFNRDADNWRPLFAIADLAGKEWAARIRKIAKDAVAQKAEQSTLDKLLANFGSSMAAPTKKATKKASRPQRRLTGWRQLKWLSTWLRSRGLRGPNTRVASQSPPALLPTPGRLNIRPRHQVRQHHGQRILPRPLQGCLCPSPPLSKRNNVTTQ